MKLFMLYKLNLKLEDAFKEKEAYELQNKFLEELSLKMI